MTEKTVNVVIGFLPPPGWERMAILAFATWFAAKVATLAAARGGGAGGWRKCGYLAGWIGLDAPAFLGPRDAPRPRAAEWLAGAGFMAAGLLLAASGMPALRGTPLLAAWAGMAAFVLVLHFGAFHLLSCAWRLGGVRARPPMEKVWLADSLADFWGRRWNRAFRDAAQALVLRPLAPRIGVRAAAGLVFLASGLAHELAITVPAGGGYGGPTLYFLLQGLGLAIERARLRATHRAVRRAFLWLVVLAPLPILFPPVFAVRVVLPLFHFLGALP